MATIRLGKRTEGRSPKIKDFVKLANLDDMVFGGWDIFPESSYDAAAKAGVLDRASSRRGEAVSCPRSSRCPPRSIANT